MADTEYVVNSALCFLSSGSKDYPYETLFDIILSFYCYEEIKKGKEILCGILNEDVCWRRDPEKKRKEVKDLIELHERVSKEKKQIKFVSDSHKRMPPIGLEIFGTLLSNLSEDIFIIKDLLPKIMDIKREVLNSADTVRQLRIDVIDLKKKFVNAVVGLDEAVKDITMNEAVEPPCLESLRGDDEAPKPSAPEFELLTLNDNSDGGRNYATALRVSTPQTHGTKRKVGNKTTAHNEKNDGQRRITRQRVIRSRSVGDVDVPDDADSEEIRDSATGPSIWRRDGDPGSAGRRSQVHRIGMNKRNNYSARTNEDNNNRSARVTAQGMRNEHREHHQTISRNSGGTGGVTASASAAASNMASSTHTSGHFKRSYAGDNSPQDDNDNWTLVDSNRGRRRRTNRNGITGVRGLNGNGNLNLKAVTRLIDVFVGRVDNDVSCEDLENYIYDVCGVQASNVSNLIIRTDEYKAFKVTVKFTEREKLFNPELWPEGIIIDKFYSRSRTESDNLRQNIQ